MKIRNLTLGVLAVGTALAGGTAVAEAATAKPAVNIVVRPYAPTFRDYTCQAPQLPSYIVPSEGGVIYSPAPGTYFPGFVTVTVTASPGPHITLIGATSWTHTFVNPGPCVVPNKTRAPFVSAIPKRLPPLSR